MTQNLSAMPQSRDGRGTAVDSSVSKLIAIGALPTMAAPYGDAAIAKNQLSPHCFSAA
jgi:hypothetical protein